MVHRRWRRTGPKTRESIPRASRTANRLLVLRRTWELRWYVPRRLKLQLGRRPLFLGARVERGVVPPAVLRWSSPPRRLRR